ncbi:EAL domain-containing protein [Phytohalomonas tamaricis]|uniref:EAL domain-containing protein n=1 Tax=Phytohalomonas tamaricis TaxID=2081032 RepID=UPI000D0B90A2|nr:EAL domain-containing protein [Phytohalomonas tamaricis]
MTISDCFLNILLIEDDEDDFIIIRDLLRQAENLSCELAWVNTYERGLAAVVSQNYDLILIDYRLGAESGLDLIHHAICMNIRTPMILLAGQDEDKLDVKALELGASDYLVKGKFDSSLLARSIRYANGRTQSINALAESEQRYRLLFKANPEPMYIHHKETLAILAVNQAALRLLGYSLCEFMQMTIPDVISPSEMQHFHAHYETVDQPIATSKLGIWALRHKDGRDINVELTAHDYHFNDQPSRLVLASDVTEIYQSRVDLLRKEKAFHQLLEDNRDALLVLDAEGRVRYANPAATLLFRSSLEMLMQRRFEMPCLDENLFEWVISTEEGEIAVEIQCSVTEWGEEAMQLLSLRDIRERKAAEKQLRLLQRSIEASYNGVAIADALAPEMPLIYVNPAFERITGYGAEEALGKNSRFLQNGDCQQPGVEEIRSSLQEQREVHTVLRNFRKDGSPFWNELYITPVRNESGIVSHYISVQNDISEQKRFESELAYNASHDVLTGLPNRSLLEDRLEQSCQLIRRHNCNLAVVLFDIDGFKPINDSMGHAAGDQVLIEVAWRLSQQIHPGDTVARMGSDEFVVLLPDLAREEDVLFIVERLMADIARPYNVDGIELRITASAGITVSDGKDQDPMHLIQQADLAMYKAKKQGRNNYQWYTKELNQKVSGSFTLRNELQKAIEAEDFELYYQPQVDTRGQRLVGMEALLRWNHVERGVISPADFIPLAEATGQIFSLSYWMLETACKHIKAINSQRVICSSVGVKISALQFQRTNFVESVKSILDKTQLDANFLELELTETILLDNAERAIQTLHKLKDLGVHITIDDFGTGFSSLNYLKRLPIDRIKIDRSFVKEIISDQHDAAITLGIISMAHHLNLQVIAEGVETEPQFAFLQKNHCDIFQGYYFSEPMPFEELKVFLHERQKTPAFKTLRHDTEEPSQTILLLDDEENILRALARVLRREGYRILTASSAQEAFELLAKNDVQVILSDQRMPEMNGTVFFSRVKDLYPNTIRIILSGYTDLKSVTDAINQGSIYKFLTKPWDDEQLRANIRQAFQHFNMAKEKGELPQMMGQS